jgi:hypothetical protein
VNLERGFVSANDTQWVISGSMPDARGAADGNANNFYASIKMTVSAK